MITRQAFHVVLRPWGVYTCTFDPQEFTGLDKLTTANVVSNKPASGFRVAGMSFAVDKTLLTLVMCVFPYSILY